MKSLCLKKIPDDLYQDLNRIKELDNRTLTSMFIEGARLRVIRPAPLCSVFPRFALRMLIVGF